MKVLDAQYVRSAMEPKDFPRDRKPEIAFAGRSNVGKSSLLNAMLGRSGLAKTSKTPGKTRTVNFFSINNRFYFVDLPGYGFAKVPRSLKQTWGTRITSYLVNREPLLMVAHLIDSRHPPTRNDHELLALLEETQTPTLIIATKFDKLKQSQRKTSIDTIRQELHLDEDSLVIPFSSETREGVKEVWQIIEDALATV